MTLDTRRTISYLVKTIEDLGLEVATLETMNKDLHGTISELRQQIDKLEDTIGNLRADQEYDEEVW